MPRRDLRAQARSIFRAALRASDPFQAVCRHARISGETLTAGGHRYKLGDFDRIFVIGAGKAGGAMARAVEQLLGRRIAGGLINVKYGHGASLRRIEINECGHPVPDRNGVAGASRIAAIANAAGERDLVICLISGGASALLPLPALPVTLAQKQQVTRLLLASGANIHEINALRKHISRVKGGQLARLAYPATVLSLLLSDVIGDDLDVIGSGPTAPDVSTFEDAKAVLDKYALWNRAPAAVRSRIEQGLAGEVLETPKPGDIAFLNTRNLVIGSNLLAVEAAAVRARELGFRTMVLSTLVQGETREIARMHAAIAAEIVRSGRPLRPPACVITGGETTVTLRGRGVGGRNQEFVLAACIDIAGLDRVVILSGGTDGTDGPTDAAGAIADGSTLARAEGLGMSPPAFLADNNSYCFFKPLGDLLITGPTNTNVMDIRVMLVGAPS
jgi:glycerate 2-kinase